MVTDCGSVDCVPVFAIGTEGLVQSLHNKLLSSHSTLNNHHLELPWQQTHPQQLTLSMTSTTLKSGSRCGLATGGGARCLRWRVSACCRYWDVFWLTSSRRLLLLSPAHAVISDYYTCIYMSNHWRNHQFPVYIATVSTCTAF